MQEKADKIELEHKVQIKCKENDREARSTKSNT